MGFFLGIALLESKGESKECEHSTSDGPREIVRRALLLLNIKDEETECSSLGNSHLVPHVHFSFAKVTLDLGLVNELGLGAKGTHLIGNIDCGIIRDQLDFGLHLSSGPICRSELNREGVEDLVHLLYLISIKNLRAALVS